MVDNHDVNYTFHKLHPTSVSDNTVRFCFHQKWLFC